MQDVTFDKKVIPKDEPHLVLPKHIKAKYKFQIRLVKYCERTWVVVFTNLFQTTIPSVLDCCT
jgi:hypothetical protein